MQKKFSYLTYNFLNQGYTILFFRHQAATMILNLRGDLAYIWLPKMGKKPFFVICDVSYIKGFWTERQILTGIFLLYVTKYSNRNPDDHIFILV